FELREFIRFNTRVASAHFDEIASRWTVTTDDDAQLSASHVVMATGCLSSAKTPDFPGLADFKGETYHTGQWPHESVDLCGKRVGIIGTGSSAIQAIPVLAEQAGHLTVFQRTPNYSIPSRNGPMTPEYEDSWKCDYPNFRARARMAPTGNLIERNEASAVDVAAPERERIYEQRWAAGGTQFMGSFSDLATNQASNDTAAQFVRQKIREMVKDGATAELLAPKDYPIGTKRICVDTHYFETFNRPNVTLVDVRHQEVETLTQKGVVTGGQEYEFDAIVFATGFDAMTGTLFSIDIQGRQGEKLKDKWEAGPRTYLGLMSNGFPNMFLITGPGSPSVLSNMMVSIEQHVDYVSDVLAHMQRESIATIEPQRAAEDAWVVHVNEVAYTTLYPKAASWYMGANIPGKPRLFLPYIGGVGSYRKRCDEVADAGYEGFDLVAVADIGSTAYTPHRTSA
ncbi:MAG: cyclohexanone monooxygenase, partial [Gammaproteobacteria bacterium]